MPKSIGRWFRGRGNRVRRSVPARPLFALLGAVLAAVALSKGLGQTASTQSPRGSTGAFVERQCDDPLLAVTACASERKPVLVEPCTRSDPLDTEVSPAIVNALPGTRELAKQGFHHRLCVHSIARSR